VPFELRLDASHAAEGWLWSDAIVFDTLAHEWTRLHAAIDLPAGSHVNFIVFTGARATPPPPPSHDGGFDAPWRAVGNDVTDFFVDLVGGANGRRGAAGYGTDTIVTWQSLRKQFALLFFKEAIL